MTGTRLLCLSCLAGLLNITMLASAAPNALQNLRPGHPRVLVTAEDFAALSVRRTHDATLDALLIQIEQHAERLIDQPLLEREQIGRRILRISRKAVERITVLTLAYHTTGEDRFARRAEAELLNVAGFSDWNPSHFLDTAEMAAAVGLGYDWLYHAFDAETRSTLRSALVRHALSLDKSAWGFDWTQEKHNWNAVCFAGMAIAALAIAEDEPTLARQWLASIRKDNPRGLKPYAPDGVYPEGPGYWSYGTTYQTLLIEALRSAIGDDLGLADAPGFVASGGFMAHARGPSGRVFNFADGSENVGFTPAFLWTAHAAGRPAWLDAWASEDWAGMIEHRSRFRVFSALWWLNMSPGDEVAEPARSWVGRGENPVAFFRENWTDSGAMWLAVKGGRASLNHGHMDAGSFVFEADGVRWAIDLGGAPYHALESTGVDLWNMKQDSQRWQIMQYRNEAHNTLVLNTQIFDVDATADITAFVPLSDDDHGRAVVDLTGVMGDGVGSAVRELVFDATLRQVTVSDTLIGLPAGSKIAWTMMTEAAVEVEPASRVAVLRRDGKNLRVEMEGEHAGHWLAEPYAVPAGLLGPERAGVTRLQWLTMPAAPGDDRSLDLRVTLRPIGGV